jgi:hypothetical protein
MCDAVTIDTAATRWHAYSAQMDANLRSLSTSTQV